VDLCSGALALVHQVVRSRSLGVIADVTAMDVMDSFARATCRRFLTQSGCAVPTPSSSAFSQVAFAMVQLGLTLEDAHSFDQPRAPAAEVSTRIEACVSASRHPHRSPRTRTSSRPDSVAAHSRCNWVFLLARRR
jgi:hypothetical protein